MKTNYAYPKCTYVELRNKKGELVYTVCKKDVKGAPFAVEDFQAMPEEYATALRAMLKFYNGHLSKEQAEYYNISTSYNAPRFVDRMGGTWTLNGLTEMATTKVYLTGDGVDMITKLSGGKKAYDVSLQDLYVLSPFIQVDENAEPEPEPEPEQEPEQETKSGLSKLLLLLAGWVLFN